MKNLLKSLFTLSVAVCLSFFMAACGSSDVCEGVECNNGSCNTEGLCECERGYTGEFCDQAKTPSTVRVTQIVIKEFPPNRLNGDSWEDDGSGPDLVIKVEDNVKVYHQTTDVLDVVKEDAQPGQDYAFETDFRIDDMEKEIIYEIQDRDVDDDGYDVFQFMISLKATTGELIDGFPEKLTISTDRAEIELTVSYSFN